MPHNGSRLQANLWFLQTDGSYPFMNHLKTAQAWTLVDESAVPSPDTLNTDGYPISISNGGVYTVFFVPLQAARAGDYVVGWSGGGTIGRRGFGHTIVSGSATNLVTGTWNGLPGRMVVELSGNAADVNGRIDLGITAIDTEDPVTDLWFVHEDDEEDFLAGSVFTQKFKDRLSNFGVVRFIDWQRVNRGNLSLWEHVSPATVFSYDTHWCPAGMFKGTTTNSGDDYTIAGVDAPADKDTICVKFNANATGTAPTLNTIAVKGPYGDTMDTSEKILANRFGTLIYDEDLEAWLKQGGSIAQGDTRGVQGGVPVSLMLQLCNEIGAHPWFHVPHWALDPPTNFATQLATACKTYADANAPWMVPRFEPANEVWNTAQGFNQTRYGWNKANARWASVQDTHNWYGRVLSLMGEAISDVYADDRSRYWVICGIQTSSTPSNSAARLESTRHVADGGGNTPSEDWATHVAPANYFSPTLSTTAELALAHEYNAGDTEEKAAAAAELIDSLSVNAAFGVPYVGDLMAAWKAWATSYDMALTYYEGGYSPDYLSSNNTGTITGASKAAQCVLTITTTQKPPVGSDVSIASVGGMTELNGNTYEVVAVNGNSVTIDVDSTGFTTYTSGGVATYVNSMTYRNALRAASKNAPILEHWLRRMYSICLTVGGSFPSCYLLSGASNAWSVLDPDVFVSPDPPQWTAIEDMATTATPIRFSIALT
jgi:hypothetical protein